MAAIVLQPVAVDLPQEKIQAAFQRVVHDLTGEADWHFALSLPRTVRAPAESAKSAESAEAPVASKGLVTLARFEYVDPLAGLTVSGQRLAMELDPADYLDFWLEEQGITAQSRKRLPLIGGAVGDVVGTWYADGVEFTGRFYCLKYGERLALLSFQTHSADYPALAESFFIAMSTFRLLRDPPGPLVGKVQVIGEAAPVRWKLVLPVSWRARMDMATAEAASFQAELLQGDAAHSEVGQSVLGKLSFAVVAPGGVRSMDEAFGKALEALRDAGLQPQATAPLPESVAPPYKMAAYLTAPLTIGNQPAEVRCRVLRHPKAWIIAAVVTPTRNAAPSLWMHNKRVLDIATRTLEIA